MVNASAQTLDFVVPVNHGPQWQLVVDTGRKDPVPVDGPKVAAGERVRLVDRSLAVFRKQV